MSREFLLTKFICSNCGNVLELELENNKHRTPIHANGEPTGSMVVQNHVFIKPCGCMTRPVENMRRAARELLSVIEEQK